jgi:hypothetical protein
VKHVDVPSLSHQVTAANMAEKPNAIAIIKSEACGYQIAQFKEGMVAQ